MTIQGIDKKVLDRVRKLLALAADGGATEAEAQLASERARQIMAENGITNATIEMAGGQGEARTKNEAAGFVAKPWMRKIMRALAKQAFVEVDYESGGMRWDDEAGQRKKFLGGWELWGRESAVATVRLMHEYLVRTVHRVARERGTPTDEVFKEAMAGRIAERIEERHEQAMAQQAREAREKNAAAAHPASASTGNALVVVLEDYAQKERDLNNDLRNGWAPGTSAEKRRVRELEVARAQAERDERLAERARQREAWLNEGIDSEVVEFMMDGFTRDRAEALVAESKTPEAQRKREREEARRRREDEAWSQRWQRRLEREAAKMSSPSYREGRRAGEHVGLDAQVNHKETRKLS